MCILYSTNEIFITTRHEYFQFSSVWRSWLESLFYGSPVRRDKKALFNYLKFPHFQAANCFFFCLRFHNWRPAIICSTQCYHVKNYYTRAILIYVDLHSFSCCYLPTFFHEYNFVLLCGFLERKIDNSFPHQQHHKRALHFIDCK